MQVDKTASIPDKKLKVASIDLFGYMGSTKI